jgi:hypothetical protein
MRSQNLTLSVVSTGSGVAMKRVDNTLRTLRHELDFVDNGGYRTPLGWRSSLVFEDSPTCSKERRSACPHTDCVLMSFVPEECRYEPVPCRRIQLNEEGETIDSLYRTGTNEEIEEALRGWLVKIINRLEKTAPFEMVPKSEKAA